MQKTRFNGGVNSFGLNSNNIVPNSSYGELSLGLGTIPARSTSEYCDKVYNNLEKFPSMKNY